MTGHEDVVFFDIDDTLILWGKAEESNVSFIEPYSGFEEEGLRHDDHIERMKQHKALGHYIIAWSGGGGRYAEKAIEALGLSDYVDLCISKPMQYYDDMDAGDFMGRRSYLGQTGMRPNEMYRPRTELIGSWEDKD